MHSSTATVLVLGAQGRFGRVATTAFANAGWRVLAQSRRTNAHWPQGVESVLCDAMDRSSVVQSAHGADIIVNALNPLYSEWEKLARPLAANALAAAEDSGALLMFPGNVYNFGKQLPQRLDSHTPEVPNTSKGRIRIEIEQQLQAAALRGVNSIVVRAGDFFGGSGRGAWLDLVIVKSLSKGKVVYPGATDRLHAWAYLPDLAQTFVRLAALRGQLRGVHRYHFRGHAITGAELYQALQRVVGRPLHLSLLPWSIIRLIAPFSPMMKATLEMRYLWQRPHILDDTPLRNLLGDLPDTPLDTALAATLAALGLVHGQPASALVD